MNKGKTKLLLSVAVVLLMATSVFAIVAPQASAHDPAWSIPTYAYISASPRTVGVGEQALLVMWLDCIPPTAGGTGGDRWTGFTVDVTAPDGAKSTLGPFESGSVGITYTAFVPDKVGKYTFVFNFPGQVLGTRNNPNPMGMIYVGDKFEASTSAPIELVVTTSPAQQWQEPQNPVGYWTRPLNGQNREQSTMASNWLLGSWIVNNWQRAGLAPNTAHIVWTEHMAEQPGVSSAHPGGIADAQWPGIPFNTDDYQSPWSSPIIMNGIIYYNQLGDAMTPRYGYYAMDLRTGKQLWYNNGTFNNPAIGNPSFGDGPALAYSYPRLSFGQLYHYNSLNGQGILAYLWMTQGNRWYMLDPDNGNLMMTLTNVPGGTGVTDQDGSILYYSFNSTTGRMTAWNSSQAIPFGAPGTGTSANQWRPRIGATVDAQNDQSWAKAPLPAGGSNGAWTAADTYHSGYSMNTTIVDSSGKPVTGLVWVNAPNYSPNFGTTRILQDANRVPRMVFSWNNPSAQGDVTGGNGTIRAWAAEITYGGAYEGPTGSLAWQSNWNLGQGLKLLWQKEWTTPLAPGNLTFINAAIDYDSGVWTMYSKETMQFYGFSLNTGEKLWGPTDPQGAWDMYGMGGTAAYGNLYSTGYDGVLHCYDIKTGQQKWTYEAPSVGSESPYGNYPLSILAIANGKVYLGSSEHSPTKPLWRGSYLRAVDALAGNELFKFQTWVDGLAIADGYLVCGNHYNNMIQAFGKGQSATTVTASDKAVTSGTAVLIEGTVTDQSPGAPGTPAIADAYMTQWMEYLYEQQDIPGNAQGVPVKLTAIDASGNSQDIGTVNSDMSGQFKTMWTPQNTGIYTIVASFGGTDSYFPSYAQTGVGVTAAAPTATATVKAAENTNTAPLEAVYALAAVLALVIIVLAVVALRKK